MYGGSEQDLQIQPTAIWVHLTYQTAFVDNAGKLQMRRDIYNLDGRTLAAIKSERGNLEPALERKRDEIAHRAPASRPCPHQGTLPPPDLPVGNTARALIYLFPALSERAQDRSIDPNHAMICWQREPKDRREFDLDHCVPKTPGCLI